jgi:hypothetical protein
LRRCASLGLVAVPILVFVVRPATIAARQVARRRNSLANALNRFDEWLNKLARDPSIPTDDVPAKVAFMLSVMNEAAPAAQDGGRVH